MAGRHEFYDDVSFGVGETVGATMPAPENDRFTATEPIISGAPEGTQVMPETDPFGAKTEIADAIMVDGKRVIQTVGWLVSIKGAIKGNDYHLHPGFNYIGNSPELEVSVPDPKVSRKPMATIAYDTVSRTFTLMRCEGATNIARCNGAPLYNPVQLNIYDVISLGDTELMFVPLCGEKFTWEEDE